MIVHEPRSELEQMKCQENAKTLLKIIFSSTRVIFGVFSRNKLYKYKNNGLNRLDHIEV